MSTSTNRPGPGRPHHRRGVDLHQPRCAYRSRPGPLWLDFEERLSGPDLNSTKFLPQPMGELGAREFLPVPVEPEAGVDALVEDASEA